MIASLVSLSAFQIVPLTLFGAERTEWYTFFSRLLREPLLRLPLPEELDADGILPLIYLHTPGQARGSRNGADDLDSELGGGSMCTAMRSEVSPTLTRTSRRCNCRSRRPLTTGQADESRSKSWSAAEFPSSTGADGTEPKMGLPSDQQWKRRIAAVPQGTAVRFQRREDHGRMDITMITHRLTNRTVCSSLCTALSSMLAISRRTAASSSRAASLASAAQASALQSRHSPPPAPTPTSAWMTPEATEEGLEDTLTSVQKRLSRIGRDAKWQKTPGPKALPTAFSHAVQDLIRQGDRKLLRDDLRRSFSERGGFGPLRDPRQQSSRAALLHLARHSPARYASIRQVLETTAARLGQPGMAGINDDGKFLWYPGWAPKRVLEAGCGTAEGAWAAAEVWPETLCEWQGQDSMGKLIKTARELLAYGSSLTNETASLEEDAHPIRKVQTFFEITKSQRDIRLTADANTLLLSAYQLLDMASDNAREQHIKKLWRSGAETIILIEEGTDRGFAAIASARALLLELGEQDQQAPLGDEAGAIGVSDKEGGEKLVLAGLEFYEERPSDRSPSADPTENAKNSEIAPLPGSRGCWVVAPCPHDRPCPLLHPFELSGPHNASPLVSSSRVSAHHQAAHVGLTSCHHPVRFNPPPWARNNVAEQARRKKERGGREERSVKISYVVVKRGQRPSFANVVKQALEGGANQRLASKALSAAAFEARRGILDELRRGDFVPRRHPEDIVGVNDPGDEDAAMARAELLALLPEQLRRAAGDAGSIGTEEKAALEQALAVLQTQSSGMNNRAEDVWKASGHVIEQRDDLDSSKREAREQNEAFLASILEQQGAASGKTGATDAAFPDPSADLDPATISGATSLLGPSLPRILLPPIKKGGHVTFDACHPSGSIQRYTIARSSGRQTYQEARKSLWADQWGQDLVELAAGQADGKLEKRKGWGQWPRISSANEDSGVKEQAASSKTTSKSFGYPHPKTTTPRASNRASAYIGADQVSPRGGAHAGKGADARDAQGRTPVDKGSKLRKEAARMISSHEKRPRC